MHDRVARSTTLLFVALACLWGTACASRYQYTLENPRNLKAPPEWTAHPTQVTQRGDFEVVGEATASEPAVAFRLAESDARARAALYFQSLADAGAGSHAEAVDETVVAQDAVTHGSTEASRVQVGGLMPVDRWYDTRAKRAYVLLRMPARESGSSTFPSGPAGVRFTTAGGTSLIPTATPRDPGCRPTS